MKAKSSVDKEARFISTSTIGGGWFVSKECAKKLEDEIDELKAALYDADNETHKVERRLDQAIRLLEALHRSGCECAQAAIEIVK